MDNKSFKFGDRVSFVGDDVSGQLKNKDWCLIGFCDSAFALVEWSKRGEYNFEYLSGDIYECLSIL